MIRILLLSATIGFTSRACYIKLLVALIVALAFLIAFLYIRPYRRSLHALMQGLAMAVPVISMGCTFQDRCRDIFCRLSFERPNSYSAL